MLIKERDVLMDKKSFFRRMLDEFHSYVDGRPKRVVVTYLVLRILVIATLVLQLLNANYYNAMLCVLTLLLFMIPAFADRQLKVKLPSVLEVVILLFAFSAEILGEIQNFYGIFHSWDTILHTMNGFMMAAIGFAMIDLLNNNPKFHFTASPLFVGFVAFCFSMTIGVLWEFFEFGMETFFHIDMQRDFIYNTIASTNKVINPTGANTAVIVNDVKTTISGTINGTPQTISFDGYLDIGIKDTMKDLMVNCIGAVVYSILGVFYIKGRGKLAEKFMPTLKTPQDIAVDSLDSESRIIKKEAIRKEKSKRRRK